MLVVVKVFSSNNCQIKKKNTHFHKVLVCPISVVSSYFNPQVVMSIFISSHCANKQKQNSVNTIVYSDIQIYSLSECLSFPDYKYSYKRFTKDSFLEKKYLLLQIFNGFFFSFTHWVLTCCKCKFF